MLDLDQWRFYMLSRQELEVTGQRSIGLSVLQERATAVTAAQLRIAAGGIIRKWRAAQTDTGAQTRA